MNGNRYLRRRIHSGIFMGLSVVATLFGMGWLALILGTLMYEGFTGIDLAIFVDSTPPPGSMGGLLNAIFGSLMMSFFAVAIGTPIGIFAGTYLAEYGRHTRLGGRHGARRYCDSGRCPDDREHAAAHPQHAA
jgi:phosphate transport system permease protein